MVLRTLPWATVRHFPSPSHIPRHRTHTPSHARWKLLACGRARGDCTLPASSVLAPENTITGSPKRRNAGPDAVKRSVSPKAAHKRSNSSTRQAEVSLRPEPSGVAHVVALGHCQVLRGPIAFPPHCIPGPSDYYYYSHSHPVTYPVEAAGR